MRFGKRQEKDFSKGLELPKKKKVRFAREIAENERSCPCRQRGNEKLPGK